MNRALAQMLPDLMVGIVALVFAVLCAAFVRQPGLGTFADDSVSYLVLAQAMSPWQPASQAVAEAVSREAFYPPLYPLLLALSGAAHDIALAHVLAAFLVAACLPLAYALGRRWLESGWAAALATLAMALLPALWINARGILSEPLYGLLLLATLLALESERRKSWLLALLMAAMVLTRTAGLVIVAFYAAWALSRPGRLIPVKLHAAMPALVALLAYAAWMLIRPVGAPDDYLRLVAERSQSLAGLDSLAASLMRQANAVAQAWIGSLLLFWVEGRPLRVALAGAAGVLCLAGVILRLRAGKPDGWIMAGYLATFLAWPFYDQMGRFLFPALPVFILYAFYAAGAGLRALGRPPMLAHGLLALLIVSVAAPALAFIHQRARAEGRVAQIIDWYRTPDLEAARARAQVQLELFSDMEAIRSLTPAGARIAWVVPSYLALLAERRGIAAPPEQLAPAQYRRALRESGAQYLFLSAFHPRDTIHDGAWKAGIAATQGRGEVLRERSGAGGAPGSLLLKIDLVALPEARP